LPIEFTPPWRKKPLPPPRQEEPPRRTVPTSELIPTKRIVGRQVVEVQPTSEDIDNFMERLAGTAPKRPKKKPEDPLQHIYFDKRETVERLTLILREYNSRNTTYRRMTIAEWLYEHGVRINP